METFRIRFGYATQPGLAIQLVCELSGIDASAAAEIVETRGVVLDRVSAAEARRISERFWRLHARVEVEQTWRHLLAYDACAADRASQVIERLRIGERMLVSQSGRLGEFEFGELERFADDAALERRVTEQLERWTARGLRLAATELEVVEAISAREPMLEAGLHEQTDDVAHSIYGDWLETRGDPRGQLIALQCALARAGPCERPNLAGQERAWRRRHASHLFGPLRPLADVLVDSWSRGFVDVATVGRFRSERQRSEFYPDVVLATLLRLPIAACMSSLTLTNMTLDPIKLAPLLAVFDRRSRLTGLDLSRCHCDARVRQLLVDARDQGRLPITTVLPRGPLES